MSGYIVGEVMENMRKWYDSKAWRPVIDAYKKEKGLPDNFELTDDHRAELSKRLSDSIMSQVKERRAQR